MSLPITVGVTAKYSDNLTLAHAPKLYDYRAELEPTRSKSRRMDYHSSYTGSAWLFFFRWLRRPRVKIIQLDFGLKEELPEESYPASGILLTNKGKDTAEKCIARVHYIFPDFQGKPEFANSIFAEGIRVNQLPWYGGFHADVKLEEPISLASGEQVSIPLLVWQKGEHPLARPPLWTGRAIGLPSRLIHIELEVSWDWHYRHSYNVGIVYESGMMRLSNGRFSKLRARLRA